MGDDVLRHVGESSPFSGIGEATSSGAHRLKQPKVRTGFRDFIVGHVRKALCDRANWWGKDGLRYASLGSGALLFDLELIERLRAWGVHVSQICLIDRVYRAPTAEVKQALREFAAWQIIASESSREAPPEILAFGHVQDYYAASFETGRTAGCHIFVHCDAQWPGAVEDCETLAYR